MPFSPETQQIIADVERLSGRPVHVEEDSSLKTSAQVPPARGVSPAHFVRCQPGNPAADYLVAYPCGFVARLFDEALPRWIAKRRIASVTPVAL